jgi:hypothetical protein
MDEKNYVLSRQGTNRFDFSTTVKNGFAGHISFKNSQTSESHADDYESFYIDSILAK